jgi:hypothetical protein
VTVFVVTHRKRQMATTFSEIENAVDFVSMEPYGTNEAYVSLDSGQIFLLSQYGDSDELPDDFEESDRYLAIPHKNDLDLGQQLVRDFIHAEAPSLAGQVNEIFQHSGAYSRFKSLLVVNGLLEVWHAFENEQATKAIRDWCDLNQLPLSPQTER